MVRIQFRRTLFLDRGVAVAKEALTRIELQLPSDEDLRIYVRLAFREIRRGRHNMSILELMRGGRTAQYFLGYFIRDRLRKTNRLFELYPDPTY